MSDSFRPTPTRGWFVTGVDTGVGKTLVSLALAHAFVARGRPVAALKPLETGVAPDPLDALALAAACGRPELATAAGLYRARRPLAPYAATLLGEPPPPTPQRLAAAVYSAAAAPDLLLVEGAGGLLVPLDAEHTMADLAADLALPLVLVAANRLGVLSSVLSCYDAAHARQLPTAAVVLTSHTDAPEPGHELNLRILAERLPVPVIAFPYLPALHRDPAALRSAALRCGLLQTLLNTERCPDNP